MNEAFWRKLLAMGKMYRCYRSYSASAQYVGLQLNAGTNVILLKDIWIECSVAVPFVIGRKLEPEQGQSVYSYNLNPFITSFNSDIANLLYSSAPFTVKLLLSLNLLAGQKMFFDFSDAPLVALGSEPCHFICTGGAITGDIRFNACFAYLTVDEFKKYL